MVTYNKAKNGLNNYAAGNIEDRSHVCHQPNLAVQFGRHPKGGALTHQPIEKRGTKMQGGYGA